MIPCKLPSKEKLKKSLYFLKNHSIVPAFFFVFSFFLFDYYFFYIYFRPSDSKVRAINSEKPDQKFVFFGPFLTR